MLKKYLLLIFSICLLSVSCTLNFGLSGKVALQMPSGKIIRTASSNYAPEDLPAEYTITVMFNVAPFQTLKTTAGKKIVLEDLEPGMYSISIKGQSKYYKLEADKKIQVKAGATSTINLPLDIELIPQEMTWQEAKNFLKSNPTKPIAFKIIGECTNANLSNFAENYLDENYRTGKAYVELDLSECTGLTSIDRGVFWNCITLRKVVLPSTVKTINDHAFTNCSSLESINLKNVETLNGECLFESCPKLKKVNLSKISAIPVRAFNGCNILSEVTFSPSLTEIGEEAFQNCYNLTEAILPDSVESIGVRSFCTCNNLTKVKLPSNLNFTVLPQMAFQSTGIEEILIPQSIIEFHSDAISNCANMKAVFFEDVATWNYPPTYGQLPVTFGPNGEENYKTMRSNGFATYTKDSKEMPVPTM